MAAALPAELAGFEVDAVVGRGSFGTVFRASRARDGGAVVAVKWVPMGADAVVAGQVRRDAEILNALQHPHVLRVLDVIEHPLGLAVVMEYACRGSLADAIATDFRLPWARMTAVAVGVADALDAAHRGGVLHCDLKPSNILLGPGGEPLVSDFGVSRWVAGEPAVSSAVLAEQQFERLLQELPALHRSILSLLRQGLSYLAIATQLDVHERTVRRIVQRIIGKARLGLEPLS